MDQIQPIVRHLIACDDILHHPVNPRRVTLVNIIHTIHPGDEPPFPLRHPEFCDLSG
jgi:hypothetical protein